MTAKELRDLNLRFCPICGLEPQISTRGGFSISCTAGKHSVTVTGATLNEVVELWNGPDPWKDMATAPEDGTPVVAMGCKPEIVLFDKAVGGWVNRSGRRCYVARWRHRLEGCL